METRENIIFRVDKKTKKGFHLYCVNNEISMQDLLSQYVSKLIQKSKTNNTEVEKCQLTK